MAIHDLTPEYLAQLFSYDPDEGVLLWRQKRGRTTFVGAVAGSNNGKGYRIVMIDGKSYQAHRLIWLMATGAWPKDQIDHINGIRSDNRLCNLREASNAVNSQNRHKPNKNSKLGIMGVFHNGNSFVAQLGGPGGGHFYLGSFPTAELAHAAYLEAKRKLHPGNTL